MGLPIPQGMAGKQRPNIVLPPHPPFSKGALFLACTLRRVSSVWASAHTASYRYSFGMCSKHAVTKDLQICRNLLKVHEDLWRLWKTGPPAMTGGKSVMCPVFTRRHADSTRAVSFAFLGVSPRRSICERQFVLCRGIPVTHLAQHSHYTFIISIARQDLAPMVLRPWQAPRGDRTFGNTKASARRIRKSEFVGCMKSF